MRRILLEFIGGSWDGMNLCNDSPDPVEAGLTLHTYSMIRNRGVGHTVVMPSDYSVKQTDCSGSEYVVTNRTVIVGNEVLVRLESCCSEATAPCAHLSKRLLLQFDGGYLHGRSLDGHSPDTDEALLAVAYYLITDQGKAGEVLDGMPAKLLFSEHATDPERVGFRKGWEYRVTQRTEDKERVLVRFEYRAKSERRSA